MKTGVTTSAILHAAALTWGLWSMSGPKPLDASYSEALPVEVTLAEEFSGVKGEKDAPVTEKPAPAPTKKPQTLPMEARNVGDNEVDLDTPPTPVAKPRAQQQTASAPPPPPASPPVPREPPKPEPPKPEKVAETPPPPPKPPEPTPPEPEAAPEPDPVEQAIADAAEIPAPVAEPKPQNVPRPAAKPTPPKPPEPKVAEKPPEPAKTPPKKPEPAKPVRTASVETPKKTSDAAKPSQESEFNEGDISALINRQKSAGGGAKRSTETASLGSKKTTGASLTRSEKDALLDQLRGCWSIPSGVMEADTLRASVSFSLDAAGRLTGSPRVDSSSGNRSFDESALRAIRKCDQAGFQLPSDKQEEWAEIIIDFSPTDMF